MEIYDPFDIVVVPFPFTDLRQTKNRPALVISTYDYQDQTQHICLLMITTAKQSAWHNDYLIKNLKQTGLKVPSIVRQKLFTLDLRLIKQTIGKLSQRDSRQIQTRLNQSLSLE